MLNRYNPLTAPQEKIEAFIHSHNVSKLLYKVMSECITVINTKTPVASRNSKPLEIFYYAPYVDEALAAVKACLILMWLQKARIPQEYDRSFSGNFSILSPELNLLQAYKDGNYSTMAERDKLWMQGINCIASYTKQDSYVVSDRVWKHGELQVPRHDVNEKSKNWHTRATLALLTEYISLADYLQMNPANLWR